MRRFFNAVMRVISSLYRYPDDSDGRNLDPAGTQSCMGIPKSKLHARRPTLGILRRDPADCWSLSDRLEQHSAPGMRLDRNPLMDGPEPYLFASTSNPHGSRSKQQLLAFSGLDLRRAEWVIIAAV